jgi:uncharacterized protein
VELASASWLDVLLNIVPLLVIVAANLAVKGLGPLSETAAWMTWMMATLIEGVTAVYALQLLAVPGQKPLAIALLVAAMVGFLTLSLRWRTLLAKVMPIDARSPLDGIAIIFTVDLVAIELGKQFSVDVVGQAAVNQPLHPIDLIVTELPLLIAGLLGVGLIIRRSPAATMKRLGFVVPTWPQVVLGLAAAGIFLILSTGIGIASQYLTPDLARKVGNANDHLYAQLNNPIGIATIALAAGIGEETLFRGALQPRVGLIWTAIVFTSVHTQYGLSLDALAVLILALSLGLIRRYTNTTTSLICHVSYNLAVGVQLAGWSLIGAGVTEVALLGILVLNALQSTRLASTPPA